MNEDIFIKEATKIGFSEEEIKVMIVKAKRTVREAEYLFGLINKKDLLGFGLEYLLNEWRKNPHQILVTKNKISKMSFNKECKYRGNPNVDCEQCQNNGYDGSVFGPCWRKDEVNDFELDGGCYLDLSANEKEQDNE